MDGVKVVKRTQFPAQESLCICENLFFSLVINRSTIEINAAEQENVDYNVQPTDAVPILVDHEDWWR
ncbi:hypothetical protein MKW98_030805 [Papaver atlanticum]|uniref:Uncharacterized protein n=1 Tax=Papaver atlanticum TaxID=357466 RepID=A0AAD4X5Q8_9MAGN|nr:hypothetical protein MKW98_030805 [Papaver atlanticum]